MARKETKKLRNMKVYDQSGYHYKSTPAIMMKGAWLREFGFEANTPIQVQCEEGRLVITRVKYQEDAVPAMCVAEPKAKYGRGRR